MASSNDDILSWANPDCRESFLFNSWGIVYQFQTSTDANSRSVTTLWRTIRASNREEKVGRLEWAPNGGLGRVALDPLGKTILRMSDLTRTDPYVSGARTFAGPDGAHYRWQPSTTSGDILLQDPNGVVIAFFRPTRPTQYQIGDVYGELHFLRTAGMGTVMHPPMMDYVIITAMLYRFCASWNL